MSRREKILESLLAGNKIHRQWKGSNLSGYLSHSLEGVPRLRESEVDELGDLVITCSRSSTYSFPPLRLRTDEDRAEEAARKAATEAAAREREQAREEKRERMAEVRRHIVSWANADLVGDRIVFTLDGHRYEIREVAAHREE